MIQILFRPLAIPLLILLYALPAPFLAVVVACRLVCLLLDDSFDLVARLAGWDARYWPLPRSWEEKIGQEADHEA